MRPSYFARMRRVLQEGKSEQATLNLEHVQADEIRVKGHRLIPWMAMAIMVSTRLWLERERIGHVYVLEQIRIFSLAH